MVTYEIVSSATVGAPAERVYAIIADYHEGHPGILPKPEFQSLVVEKGGVGAGTEIRVTMRVMGATQTFRAVVTEPQPGRVLVETNDNGFTTAFEVEPRGAQASYVTFRTTMEAGGGLFGRLKHRFYQRVLGPVYRRELANLAAAATGQPVAS